MEYKYIHDATAKIVYRFPKVPEISSKQDRKGHIITYTASMEVEITRADNVLRNSQWKYPVREYPKQHFENIANRYNEELVSSYFHQHHDPHGEVIDEKQYEELRKKYKENK